MRVVAIATVLLALCLDLAAGQCYFKKDANTVLLLSFNSQAGTISNGVTVADQSDAKNNGQMVGSGVYKQGAEGKYGLYLGKTDYIKIPHSVSLNPRDELTVEIWAAVEMQNAHSLLRKKDAYNYPDLQGTATVSAHVMGDDSVPHRATAFRMALNTADSKARYFAMTFKAKEMKMYFTENSSPPRALTEETQAVPDNVRIKVSSEELRIGRNFDDDAYAEHFQGIIYSVRISKIARTCGEIQANQFCDAVAQINECCTNPCQNGGKCKDEVNKYTCQCPAGYTGTHCEKTDECAKKPCQNGGICKQITANPGYSCSCPIGFIGQHCETRVDKCTTLKPCKNGGTCRRTSGTPGYSCTCLPAFAGQHCQTQINDCTTKPCLNNGVCVDHLADYRCICTKDFTGKNCQDTFRVQVPIWAVWIVLAIIIFILLLLVIVCVVCILLRNRSKEPPAPQTAYVHEVKTPTTWVPDGVRVITNGNMI